MPRVFVSGQFSGHVLMVGKYPTMANRGLATAPLPLAVIAATLAAAVLFALLTHFEKIPVSRRLKIA